MEKLDPVDEWLINFTSEKTKRGYRYWFNKFLRFTHKTPKELLDATETRDGRRQVDLLTKQFFNQLVAEGYSKLSANIAMNSVRSFFKYCGERLPPIPESFAPPKEPTYEQRKSLSSEEFQKMLAKCETPYEKLILETLADTGGRRGVLTALRLRHVKDGLQEDAPAIIEVPSELLNKDDENVNKEKVSHRTGLTAKTVNELLEHLEKRRKHKERVTAESWLLADEAGKPLSPEHIYRLVQRTAKEAKIQRTVQGKRKRKYRAIHPHIFRSYLKARMKEKGVLDEIFLKLLLGHQEMYRGAYDRYTDDQIREAYRKLETQPSSSTTGAASSSGLPKI